MKVIPVLKMARGHFTSGLQTICLIFWNAVWWDKVFSMFIMNKTALRNEKEWVLSTEKWPMQMKNILLLMEAISGFDTRACFLSPYYQHWLPAETKAQNIHAGCKSVKRRRKVREGDSCYDWGTKIPEMQIIALEQSSIKKDIKSG